MTRHAILVVGTGRSGTSAMAGLLQILGAQLGTDLKPGDPFNRKGYFENTRITDLNKRILTGAGMTWYGGSPPEALHAVELTPTRANAVRDLVFAIFKGATPLALKDPRLCLLLEVYVSALRAMGYAVHCVRMLREFDAVTRSLTAVAGPAPWLPLVTRHAELLDEALSRAAVNCIDCQFGDLVSAPTEVADTIVERLPFLAFPVEKKGEVLTFVDESLRRHG